MQVLRERFTAPDAPGLLRLILHDAATYDADAGVGGFDGSILLSRWVVMCLSACGVGVL